MKVGDASDAHGVPSHSIPLTVDTFVFDAIVNHGLVNSFRVSFPPFDFFTPAFSLAIPKDSELVNIQPVSSILEVVRAMGHAVFDVPHNVLLTPTRREIFCVAKHAIPRTADLRFEPAHQRLQMVSEVFALRSHFHSKTAGQIFFAFFASRFPLVVHTAGTFEVAGLHDQLVVVFTAVSHESRAS